MTNFRVELPTGKRLSDYSADDLAPYGVLPAGEPALYSPFRWFGAWKVKDAFCYISKEGWFIEVEGNFLTDLASIPRAFRMFYGGDGRESIGAILHDHLYQHRDDRKRLNVLTWESRTLTRAEADEILYDVCRLAWCSPIRAWTIYRGVRAGGWLAWRRYGKTSREERRASNKS